jgi:hypothetical protein
MNLFTFWFGPRLTYIERLCLSSMVAVGHEVHLYSYDKHLAVPAGVKIMDARTFLPESGAVRAAKTGTIALFADIFRYEGLSLGAGIWVDTDILLIRDIKNMGDYLFGWEDERSINNAVLLMPPESKCLKEIRDLAMRHVVVPPFWSVRRRLIQRTRSLVGAHQRIEELGWGIIGPRAITYFVKEHGLLHKVQPSPVFYPIHYKNAERFWSAEGDVEANLNSNTRAVHLWGKGLKQHQIHPPPTGCFITRMCKRFSIDLGEAK